MRVYSQQSSVMLQLGRLLLLLWLLLLLLLLLLQQERRVNASGQTRTNKHHEGCHLLQYASHIQPKLRDLIL